MSERDHYDFDPEGAMERGHLHQLDLIYFSLKGDRDELIQLLSPVGMPYVENCIQGLTNESEEHLLRTPSSELSHAMIIEIIKLARIERALNRFRTVLYGICIDCERDIPLTRLKKHSTAERCLRCQQQEEGRLFGRLQ